MITLLTGLPGNGKGVYGLDWLKHKAEKEERTVYYSGINECMIPGWIELDDPTQWYRCPPNSYILIDECQRIFRTRANGSTVPPHVAELETHRHNGHDLLLITQHPMLIDQNIRRLVGQHFHIVRKFGMQKAVVHEWPSVVEQPGKNRRDSIRHDYSYNKEVYGWYKSAEVHTVKRNIPKRYYFMFLAPVLVTGLIYIAYTKLDPSRSKLNPANNPSLASNAQSGTVSKAEPKPDYFVDHTPRIAGLPQTAPVYDKVTNPTVAPVPAACVLIRNKCTCYTQQATKLMTDDATCRQIVQNGYFIDFESKPLQSVDQKERAPTAQVAERTGYEAPKGGEAVAPASVDVAQHEQERIPPNIVRDSIRNSQWGYKDPS